MVSRSTGTSEIVVTMYFLSLPTTGFAGPVSPRWQSPTEVSGTVTRHVTRRWQVIIITHGHE